MGDQAQRPSRVAETTFPSGVHPRHHGGMGLLRGRLWRWLGGATDPLGNPIASSDDWVAVFEGRPDDARRLADALEEASLETETSVYSPQLAGHPEPPRGVVSVRLRDQDRANELVAGLGHFGNLLRPAGAVSTSRPKGFTSLAEFDEREGADALLEALTSVGLKSALLEREPSPIDPPGWIVAVRYQDVDAASEVLDALNDQ